MSLGPSWSNLAATDELAAWQAGRTILFRLGGPSRERNAHGFRNGLSDCLWPIGNWRGVTSDITAPQPMASHYRAEFYDVGAADTFHGRGNYAAVNAATRSLRARDFEVVLAHFRTGETAHADVSAIDYVFERLGDWE